ncbi:DUF58 domain-containing protein [Neptuniibacter caesariensis]|uniref:DUF58 domain-containing protein n=1 Tax=Neptuniibacter caesariensis TaxID=207954 RepID=A0A7U8C2B9_NEPCE|nr:DUF58 domain-containing protein [Neptuniibacter caesariensis]EAR60158.1 hypothetical protein MED92_08882 [Oceanospirillum sp. MED92] [Neptuniibacter caesariensis]
MYAFFAPIKRWSDQWAAKRRPKGHSIELNQKRIFIFPTAAGWGYLLVCCVLILIGLNYQNNLVYAFAFLLISLGVLTIHYTFLNLSGLNISAIRTRNCFAKENADFIVKAFSNCQRDYESIELNWEGQPGVKVALDRGVSKEVVLNVKTIKRGFVNPGALRIQTVYPLGLLRAWSWIDLQMSAVAYPIPIEGPSPDKDLEHSEGEQGRSRGGDDFSGLEEYQAGQSTRHIAWKQFAQGKGLLTKQYSGQKSKDVWLRWADWPGASSERRLSIMTYWALQLENQGVRYGLDLTGTRLPPAIGPEHLDTVLTKLALYGEDSLLRSNR